MEDAPGWKEKIFSNGILTQLPTECRLYDALRFLTDRVGTLHLHSLLALAHTWAILSHLPELLTDIIRNMAKDAL